MLERYVLGFCFTPTGGCILMERKKNDWQHGFVNGLGGSIEEGETPLEAMMREFYEESGIQTNYRQWSYGGVLSNIDREMHIFRGDLHFEPDLGYRTSRGIVCISDVCPDHMGRTARWLYWYCQDKSAFSKVNLSNDPLTGKEQ